MNLTRIAFAFIALALQSPAAELKLGTAAGPINPPLGTGLAGYYHERGHEGVLDDIVVKATVLDDGQTRAAIVVCDLISMPKWLVTEARKRVEERTGIPGANVIEHASYTGISVGWGWGTPSYARRNRILGNRVSGYKELLADGAGWYALGSQPESEVGRNFFQREVHGGSGGVIYPDEGSQGWTIYENVVDVAADRRWTYRWVNTIKNLTYRDNWMNSAMILNHGSNIVMTNNTLVTGPWPAPARQIVDESGLEPAGRDVATLREGCAVQRP